MTFLEPVVVEGDRAAVEWHAVSHERDGDETELAGISILRFRDDGLVVEERGYWNVKSTAT